MLLKRMFPQGGVAQRVGPRGSTRWVTWLNTLSQLQNQIKN